MKINKILCVFLLFTLFVAAGCQKGSDGKTESDAPFVSIQKVQKKLVKQVYKTTGTLKGIQDVTVYSKINGKFVAYDVEEGQYVEKDQVIARIDRDITGLKYEPALIKSPISGLVSQLTCDKGQMISPGQIPVAFVSQMNMMETTIAVPERYYPMLRRNRPVEIRVEAYPDEDFKGTITMISPVSDSLTHTVDLRLQIPNPGLKLRSGMFAQVTLILDEHEGVVVPEEAVINNEFVFVYEDGTARLRQVLTGIEDNTYLEIMEGLVPGEDLIVVGQKYIRDGMTVRIR